MAQVSSSEFIDALLVAFQYSEKIHEKSVGLVAEAEVRRDEAKQAKDEAFARLEEARKRFGIGSEEGTKPRQSWNQGVVNHSVLMTPTPATPRKVSYFKSPAPHKEGVKSGQQNDAMKTPQYTKSPFSMNKSVSKSPFLKKQTEKDTDAKSSSFDNLNYDANATSNQSSSNPAPRFRMRRSSMSSFTGYQNKKNKEDIDEAVNLKKSKDDSSIDAAGPEVKNEEAPVEMEAEEPVEETKTGSQEENDQNDDNLIVSENSTSLQLLPEKPGISRGVSGKSKLFEALRKNSERKFEKKTVRGLDSGLQPQNKHESSKEDEKPTESKDTEGTNEQMQKPSSSKAADVESTEEAPTNDTTKSTGEVTKPISKAAKFFSKRKNQGGDSTDALEKKIVNAESPSPEKVEEVKTSEPVEVSKGSAQEEPKESEKKDLADNPDSSSDTPGKNSVVSVRMSIAERIKQAKERDQKNRAESQKQPWLKDVRNRKNEAKKSSFVPSAYKSAECPKESAVKENLPALEESGETSNAETNGSVSSISSTKADGKDDSPDGSKDFQEETQNVTVSVPPPESKKTEEEENPPNLSDALASLPSSKISSSSSPSICSASTASVNNTTSGISAKNRGEPSTPMRSTRQGMKKQNSKKKMQRPNQHLEKLDATSVFDLAKPRTREWMNQNLECDRLGLVKGFVMASFGTRTNEKTKKVRVYTIVLNDEYNELALSTGDIQTFYIGKNSNSKKTKPTLRDRAAEALVAPPQKEPVALFFAPKRTLDSDDIYYVGHWLVSDGKMLSPPRSVKGQMRQALAKFTFVGVDNRIVAAMNKDIESPATSDPANEDV